MTVHADEVLKPLALSGGVAQNVETPKKGSPIPTGEAYVMEPKFDGWRLIAHVEEAKVSFYSRSGKSYNGKLPLVEAELLAHLPVGTWLDGEAVALTYVNGGVINDWSVAQSVLSKVGPDAASSKITFMVFDLLAHRGLDARPLPLAKRRVLLERIFEAPFEAVQLSPAYEASEDRHEAMIAAGFEGTVVKRLDRLYASGKREGAGWLRFKPQATIDAVIMGFKPGENSYTGLVGAVVFGQYDKTGQLVERGRCSGFDYRTRLWITKNIDKLIAERAVIEVAHHGAMKGGLRHPQWKRMRKDRAPESVVIHNG